MFWLDIRPWSKIGRRRLRCLAYTCWFPIIYFYWKSQYLFLFWGVGVETKYFMITSCDTLFLFLSSTEFSIAVSFSTSLHISPYTSRVSTQALMITVRSYLTFVYIQESHSAHHTQRKQYGIRVIELRFNL